MRTLPSTVCKSTVQVYGVQVQYKETNRCGIGDLGGVYNTLETASPELDFEFDFVCQPPW